MSKKTAAVLLAASVTLGGCAGDRTGGIKILPPSPDKAEKAEKIISREFDFYSDEEGIYYYDFPKTCVQDGHTYALCPDVSYQTIGVREVVETIEPMNVEELEDVPDTFEYESGSGRVYRLDSEQIFVRQQGTVKVPVTEEIEYEDQAGRPSVPTLREIACYDRKTGKDVKVEGRLRGIEETESGHWSSMLGINGVFSAPSEAVETYRLSGQKDVTVPGTAEKPVWDGYETDILSALGLDNDYYRITDAAWDGESYEKDGQIQRDANFYGDAFVSSYLATYKGEWETDGYAVTVFYRADADEVQAEEEDIRTVYHIRASADYALEG